MRVKDARQTFLGVWLRNLIDGVPIQVFGDGRQLRDFNFVDDVVDALLLAAGDPRAAGQVYNLGSEEVVSLEALAEDADPCTQRGGVPDRALSCGS